MDAKKLVMAIGAFLEEGLNGKGLGEIVSFQDKGIRLSDDGLVVEMCDGIVFHVLVTKPFLPITADDLTRAEQIAEREMIQTGQPVVNEDGS